MTTSSRPFASVKSEIFGSAEAGPAANAAATTAAKPIARIDGQLASSLAVLRDLVAAKRPGDSMTLTVYRSTNGASWKLMNVNVKLGRQPSSPSG